MSKLCQSGRVYFVQALVVVQVLVASSAIAEDELLHHGHRIVAKGMTPPYREYQVKQRQLLGLNTSG